MEMTMGSPTTPWAFEDEVLSPESYVFVALMPEEEGPNKAGLQHILDALNRLLELPSAVLPG